MRNSSRPISPWDFPRPTFSIPDPPSSYAGSQEEAEVVADGLLKAYLDAEDNFESNLLSAETAVAEAMAHTGSKPVIIADAQDNPGAGASSDTTGLLDALVRGNAQGAVLALLDDAEAATKAHEMGVGAEFSAMLGGSLVEEGQYPFEGRFRVESLSHGEFTFTGAMFGGVAANLGPTTVLRVLDTPADVRIVPVPNVVSVWIRRSSGILVLTRQNSASSPSRAACTSELTLNPWLTRSW